jgi:hypothetical protein
MKAAFRKRFVTLKVCEPASVRCTGFLTTEHVVVGSVLLCRGSHCAITTFITVDTMCHSFSTQYGLCGGTPAPLWHLGDGEGQKQQLP